MELVFAGKELRADGSVLSLKKPRPWLQSSLHGGWKMKDNEKFFDMRIYERYIKEGEITLKDYEKHVKSLPDVSDKATFLIIDEEEETGEQEE